MASGFVIRKNQYYDSVFLMGINKRLLEVKGVQKTAVLMGTEKNKQLLADIGILDPQIDAAQANDLIVAVVAETVSIVNDVMSRLDEILQTNLAGLPVSSLHTLEDGLAEKPTANLVVISIPGEYAEREALKALDAGKNVFIFSSNVSIDGELRLKQLATQRGLLVMGPDCGTSLIGGVGIGFANVVRKGNIGVIGASGTGLQEFTCMVHNLGFGISHAIGTGSHDLLDEVGGLTTLTALDALENDKQTEVITVISKPPGMRTLIKLFGRIEACHKPVIGCFLGMTDRPVGAPSKLQFTRTVDEAVQSAIVCAGGSFSTSEIFTPEEHLRIQQERASWRTEQKYLRGLFAGGTFCYQAQQILRDAGIPVYSNAPLEAKYRLDDPDHSIDHTLVDMGDDYYTLGKPHPMIDGTLRRQRILRECCDPQVAVLLLDFILGYNVSMDPVGELLDAILEAQDVVRRRGGRLTVVASICGTEGDLQDLSLQRKMLNDAGAIVFDSNAKATTFCAELLKPG